MHHFPHHLRPHGAPRTARQGIRWGGGLVAAVIAAAALAPAATAAAPGQRVVVTAEIGGTAAAARAVSHAGGHVSALIPLVDGVAALVPAGRLDDLRDRPEIASVVADRRLTPRGDSQVAPVPTDVATVAATLRADALGATGADGRGIDVALIDTGVDDHPLFDGRVADGPDFSSTADDERSHNLDGFGHGTHMAGIIAGVAPGARIVNVKVAEYDGSTTLSRLLTAIDWVAREGTRGEFAVRVLNLSYGAPSTGDYRHDPLAFALERAQQRGVSAVVAGGNGGEEGIGLDSPASDPNLIAVGADDAAGTTGLEDDAVPVWSSRGDGVRDPDVIAPGTGIVSIGVPGGLLYEGFPEARVGEDEFRGSGTSQAAAAVSGAAAAVLSARSLSPAQLKAVLRATARPLPGTSPAAQGAGVVDAVAAAQATLPEGLPRHRPATGGGSWNGAGAPAVQLAVDERASRWSASRWSASRWSASRWSASRWSASRWSASRWSASRWSASRWSASRWSASRWSASRWSASRWSASRWSTGDWASTG